MRPLDRSLATPSRLGLLLDERFRADQEPRRRGGRLRGETHVGILCSARGLRCRGVARPALQPQAGPIGVLAWTDPVETLPSLLHWAARPESAPVASHLQTAPILVRVLARSGLIDRPPPRRLGFRVAPLAGFQERGSLRKCPPRARRIIMHVLGRWTLRSARPRALEPHIRRAPRGDQVQQAVRGTAVPRRAACVA